MFTNRAASGWMLGSQKTGKHRQVFCDVCVYVLVFAYLFPKMLKGELNKVELIDICDMSGKYTFRAFFGVHINCWLRSLQIGSLKLIKKAQCNHLQLKLSLRKI